MAFKRPRQSLLTTSPEQYQMEQQRLATRKQFLNKKIRNTKVVYTQNYQTGQEPTRKNYNKPALPPGKRVSKSGKIYYENRRNRSRQIENNENKVDTDIGI